MKNIIFWAIIIAMWAGIFAYIPIAYQKEQCGHVESWLQEKQENPEMYPGLDLTDDLKTMCPNIQSRLGL